MGVHRSDQLVIVTAGFQADSRTLHKTLQVCVWRTSVVCLVDPRCNGCVKTRGERGKTRLVSTHLSFVLSV